MIYYEGPWVFSSSCLFLKSKLPFKSAGQTEIRSGVVRESWVRLDLGLPWGEIADLGLPWGEITLAIIAIGLWCGMMEIDFVRLSEGFLSRTFAGTVLFGGNEGTGRSETVLAGLGLWSEVMDLDRRRRSSSGIFAGTFLIGGGGGVNFFTPDLSGTL